MELPEAALHVWAIEVGSPPVDLRGRLSPDEARRAERFRFDRDRDAFIWTRAAVRTLAASYLGISPAGVELSYGPQGKPGIEGLSFNASHSGDRAVVAFAAAGRVGVDVELMRTDVELRDLARRFFTTRENEALSALAGTDLAEGFYGCWTRKEAYVKAVGDGLSFELDRIEVAVAPEPARVVAVDGDVAAAQRWTMRDLDVAPGYAAAVACDFPAVDVSLRPWSATVPA